MNKEIVTVRVTSNPGNVATPGGQYVEVEIVKELEDGQADGAAVARRAAEAYSTAIEQLAAPKTEESSTR